MHRRLYARSFYFSVYFPLTSRSHRLPLIQCFVIAPSSVQPLFLLPLALDYIFDTVSMYCYPQHTLGSFYDPKSTTHNRTLMVNLESGRSGYSEA